MKKIVITLVCTLVISAVLLMTLFVMPVLHENECRTRVFSDLEAGLGKVSGGIIGIIPKTGADSYGGGGSGFVFRKKDGLYYALTAAHVISSKSAEYKVYSTKTQVGRLNDPALAAAGITVVDDSFYNSLSPLTVEYVSPHTDIAVVSFRSDEELDCITLAGNDPVKDDRLMCLGMLDDRMLTPTYGTVTAGLSEVSFTGGLTATEKSDNVVEHDAYISFGNSGGPAINESLTAAGMNIGGEFTRFEHFKYGYLIPASELNKCISDWEASDKD